MDIISRALAYKEIMHYRNSCYDCPFSNNRNGFDKCCHDLDENQLIDIYLRESKQTKTEGKTMTKEEEIQQEIEKTQKQLEVLQKKLEDAKKENCMQEELIFKDKDEYWYVDNTGDIYLTSYTHISPGDIGRVHNHRAFLSKEYAEEFAKKTQIIADMLHFKHLYDRDYKPNWESSCEEKWTIAFDHALYNGGIRPKKFVAVYYTNRELIEIVHFSTQELAERCAEWLNKKYGYAKE